MAKTHRAIAAVTTAAPGVAAADVRKARSALDAGAGAKPFACPTCSR
jgi:hypothetical protein